MRNFLPYLNGFIKICIQGGQTERFLNLCMSRGIILWDLSGAPDGSYSCFLSTEHFFLLAPARRKTKVQIHILEKHGLPFFFANSKNKKAFLQESCYAESCFLFCQAVSGIYILKETESTRHRKY